MDRLGWAAGFVFSGFGARVGVRTNEPSILPELVNRLPFGTKIVRGRRVEHLYSLRVGGESRRRSRSKRRIRKFHLLYAGAEQAARSLDLSEVLGEFEKDAQLCVAENSKNRVFIHAGAIGWQGEAILIPGYSHVGKTSMVTEFLRRGATYYSDEFALLDYRGRLHSFARPLGIRDGDADPVPTPVEDFTSKVGTAPIPVSLVASLRYRPDSRWNVRPLSSGQGVIELLRRSLSVRTRPEPALRALGAVAEQATFLKGTRGEVGEAVDRLLRRLESGERGHRTRGVA